MNLKMLGLIPKTLRVSGSWAQSVVLRPGRLSMNLKMLGLIPKTLRVSGSWAQSVVLRPGRLSMNLKMLGLIPKTLRVSGSCAQSVVLRPGRLSLHEPEDPRLDSEDLTCLRFMGTERGSETREATHEAERRSPARRGVACPECADLEIGARRPRFMVAMRA